MKRGEYAYPTARYDANGSKIQMKKFMSEVAAQDKGDHT